MYDILTFEISFVVCQLKLPGFEIGDILISLNSEFLINSTCTTHRYSMCECFKLQLSETLKKIKAKNSNASEPPHLSVEIFRAQPSGAILFVR